MYDNCGFVTLLSSENYLEAVLVLKRSLDHVKSEYPLICGVTTDIYTEKVVGILKKEGILVEKIERLEYSIYTRTEWVDRPVLNTASKISLFSLKKYDKLCYLDTDSFVLKNIDDVFDRLDGTMIKESEEDYGFTGMFIFCPRNHREEYYKFLLVNKKCADGDLLGDLWFYTRTSKEHWLDVNYFRPYHQIKNRLESGESNFEEVKAVHFLNEDKPWIHFDRFPENNPIIEMYYQYLQWIKQDYGL